MTTITVDIYEKDTNYTAKAFHALNARCQKMTAVLAKFQDKHFRKVRTDFFVTGRSIPTPDLGTNHVWNDEHYITVVRIENNQLTVDMVNELIDTISKEFTA